MAKTDYTYDPKFANWNRFYDDLFLEIAEIRKAGHSALLDIGNKNGQLLIYYSRVLNLFSTHKHFVTDEDTLESTLSNMGGTLFSPKYIKAQSDGKFDSVQHKKIYDALQGVFTSMCSSFSNNGISVKVSGKKKRDKGKAILEGYA